MQTPNVESSQEDLRRRPATSPARVLIVDDNQVIRVALSGVIRQDPRLTVVGEATTGEMALEAIKTLQPHVVCLDVLMPGMGGLATLKQISEEHRAVRPIMITGAGTSEIVKEALALGAKGFVVKPFNATQVLQAIYRALGQ